MYRSVKYTEEFKQIMDLFEEIVPWQRIDVIYMLINKYMNMSDIAKEFLEPSGYVDPDDIDPVQEVMSCGLETEVLDQISDSDICDYLIHDSFYTEENIRYMLKWINMSDLERGIDGLHDDKIKEIFEYIRDNNKELKESIIEILKGEENGKD